MKNKIVFSFFLIMIILLISACGRRNRNETENDESYETGSWDIPAADYTITVSLGAWNYGFSEIARAVIESEAAQGREVSIGFITYTQDEIETHYNQMLDIFDASPDIAPDIIITSLDYIPWSFIQGGFLADLNGFISNKSNFFENVLYANEINGKLYSMPLTFRFDFVGINSNLPQSFINRFAELDRVNIMDMTVFYNDLIYEYPEFAQYNIIRDLDPMLSILLEVSQNINFTEQSADFSGLYDFIEIRHLFENNDSENYMFSLGRDPIDTMFPFIETSFIHYVPFSDMQGRLINESRQVVSLSHTAPPLAWAFVEELIASMDIHHFGGLMSISRDNMRDTLENNMTHQLLRHEGRTFEGNQYENIQNILYKMEVYTEMPISTYMFARMLPQDIDISNLTLLEDFIANWLNDPQYYTPAPVYEVVDDLMQRTLTVRASSNFVPVINQARDMLNTSWQESGMPYRLTINIDEHESIEWRGDSALWLADRAAREARLRTELMAGMGPDLFFQDDVSFPIYEFVQSGHLMDFYTLIDNCNYTSRDDFFMNALKQMSFEEGFMNFL